MVQSYITLNILLGLVSLLLTLGAAIYAGSNKLMGGHVSPAYMVVTNCLLCLNILTQGLVSLLTSLFLMWSYSNKRRVSGGDILFMTTDIRFFNFQGHLSIDLFGSLIICLAFFVGLISLLVSDTRVKAESTKLFVYFQLFTIIVMGFVMLQDVYTLFIFYELLLLPSFLFVLFGSYTNKSVQASLYFVIWTQIGSFLVLVGVVYLVNLVGSSDLFAIRRFKFKHNEIWALYTLFFVGFGIKVPIWPFHYWLTKTHVEAPSGFSIYLSGFLVKTALYGFFKITNLFSYEGSTLAFAVIAVVGVVDASLKLWGQSDLKKIVAYCTVQEMNLIFLLFLLGDVNATTCGAIFSIAHAFLSTLMFFLVDCIYRRFHTRSVFAVHGLLQQTPNLAMAIFLMCVLYAGLPGTLKFTCEVSLLITLGEGGLVPVLIILFFANFLGLIGFSKNWFNVIFGLPSKELDRPVLDLSLKEALIIFLVVTCFILTNGLSMLAI